MICFIFLWIFMKMANLFKFYDFLWNFMNWQACYRPFINKVRQPCISGTFLALPQKLLGILEFGTNQRIQHEILYKIGPTWFSNPRPPYRYKLLRRSVTSTSTSPSDDTPTNLRTNHNSPTTHHHESTEFYWQDEGQSVAVEGKVPSYVNLSNFNEKAWKKMKKST